MNIRHLKKGLLALNIVLTGLILYTGTMIFYEWKSKNRTGQGLEPSIAQKSRALKGAPGQTIHPGTYQKIVGRDIFHTTPSPSETGSAESLQEEIITPTRLDLRLKGTILGDGQAFAVISEGMKHEEGIYTLNDSLQNARIVEIQPNQVILNVNGRKEALILFSDREGAADQSGSPTPQAVPRLRPADLRRSPTGLRPPARVPGRR